MQVTQKEFLDKFKDSIQNHFKTKFQSQVDIEDDQKIQEFYATNLKIHTEIDKEQDEYIQK
jgi:hypothetical protein